MMECPTDAISVVYWENYLRSAATSVDEKAGPMHRQRMDSIKVVELLRMKERSGVKHEYFAVKIDHPDCGRRYIRIDRAGGDVLPTSNDNGSSTSLSDSSNSSRPREARDRVISTTNLPIDDKMIERVKVPNRRIRLVDIAIAAKVVHEHDQTYRMLKGQCFWYSDMVLRVLETVFKKVNVPNRFRELEPLGPALEQQDAFSPEWEAEVLSKDGGTLSHVRIYTRRMADVEQVSEVLKKELKDFGDQVQGAEVAVQEIVAVREQAARLEEENLALQDQNVSLQDQNVSLQEEIARLRANQQAGPSRR